MTNLTNGPPNSELVAEAPLREEVLALLAQQLLPAPPVDEAWQAVLDAEDKEAEAFAAKPPLSESAVAAHVAAGHARWLLIKEPLRGIILRTFLAHPSVRGCARALRISRGRIRRMLEEPEFRLALADEQEKILVRIRASLAEAGSEAIELLTRIVLDEMSPTPLRIKASTAILKSLAAIGNPPRKPRPPVQAQWNRIQTIIIQTLTPFPEALDAVETVWREIDIEDPRPRDSSPKKRPPRDLGPPTARLLSQAKQTRELQSVDSDSGRARLTGLRERSRVLAQAASKSPRPKEAPMED